MLAREDDPGKETVTIINISPNAIDLTDWMLADKADKREALGVDLLGPGQCKQVVLSGRGAQLSNKGGRAPF